MVKEGDLDVLLLAEVSLRREGQLAVSACVIGIGGAFMRAADAIDQCVQAVAASRLASAAGEPPPNVSMAAENGIAALEKLDRFLHRPPGESTPVVEILTRLASAGSNGEVCTKEAMTPLVTRIASSESESESLLDPEALRITEENGPTRVGELLRFLSDGEFNAWELEGRVDEARLDALIGGAQPTEAELQSWRDAVMQSEQLDAPRYHLVGLYEARNAAGEVCVWANLFEDQGEVYERVGPFQSVQAVERALQNIGRLTWGDE